MELERLVRPGTTTIEMDTEVQEGRECQTLHGEPGIQNQGKIPDRKTSAKVGGCEMAWHVHGMVSSLCHIIRRVKQKIRQEMEARCSLKIIIFFTQLPFFCFYIHLGN